jgi:hypothetical protein
MPAAAVLAGCALDMTLRARDNGQVYKGSAHPDGLGSGSIEMTVDGRTYTGTMQRNSATGGFVLAASGAAFGMARRPAIRGYGEGSAQPGISGLGNAQRLRAHRLRTVHNNV